MIFFSIIQVKRYDNYTRTEEEQKISKQNQFLFCLFSSKDFLFIEFT